MINFTDFAIKTLEDRYLTNGETPEDMVQRVSKTYSSNNSHAERIFHYISNFWFMPATPILANGGTKRGLPISCYLNSVSDSLSGIKDIWNENISIASMGGGIGTSWSNVRSIGEHIQNKGASSGIIPFMRVMDSLTLAISQGSLRRGSSACYLHISHPEIEEFLEIRKPSGDFNRKCLNLHQGIVINDKFMKAVENDEEFELISPSNKRIMKKINARLLMELILKTKMATGEPYLVFEDTINRCLPEHHEKLGLKVTQSNLCSEITLPTGIDYTGNNRTAVCCLSSINAEYLDNWYPHRELFIEDCLRFLDNVLNDFIDKTENIPELKTARHSAIHERSVGLGCMGFHSYLQKENIAFESFQAKNFNNLLFKTIRENADKANLKLSKELGPCKDAEKVGVDKRFSYMMAIAPTASISIIAGESSPCIEPWNGNIFTQKTLSGSFPVKNKYLKNILKSIGKNTSQVWDQILEDQGSVKNLDFLTEDQKKIFKTAFEIDQRWLIDFAADRSKYIDQAQSINLFLNADVSKDDLFNLHYQAWKKGIKSLYYLRSKSIQRAGFSGAVEADNKLEKKKYLGTVRESSNYDECLSCQ